MNAGAGFSILKKGELFERLAQGQAARLTVLTPNKRLSQALMLEFDAFQIGKALSVWETPDILPFGAFVQRLYEEASMRTSRPSCRCFSRRRRRRNSGTR